MSAQEMDEGNRRESFRIDDTVTLSVRVLDDETLDLINGDFNRFRMRYCMKSHIQNQKEVRKPKLIRIKKKDSDVAEYLESLELQIAQLAERLDENGRNTKDIEEFTCRANLSATGIRFRTDMPLLEDQHVELGMLLSTHNTQVVVIAKVLRVEERPDDKIAVSTLYTTIHPEDTEAIMRHLARLQQLELQSRRGVG